MTTAGDITLNDVTNDINGEVLITQLGGTDTTTITSTGTLNLFTANASDAPGTVGTFNFTAEDFNNGGGDLGAPADILTLIFKKRCFCCRIRPFKCVNSDGGFSCHRYHRWCRQV